MNRSEKFWDKRAREYDQNERKYQQTYGKIIANTKPYLKSNDIVLDYGCGTGIITHEIARCVQEIQALDISPKMIAAARKKAVESSLTNVHYAQTTIFDEVFTTSGYDVILAFNVLHLVHDTPMVMHRIHELLKSGGMFISTTACMGEKKNAFTIFLSLLMKTGVVPSMHFFSIPELEALITNQYFVIVETAISEEIAPNYFIAAKAV